MARIKNLDDFNFKGKVVILRSDINSSVVNGKVILSERIEETSKTIKELLKRQAKVIVLAHQSNPGEEDFISLRQHAIFLNKFVKIDFVEDIVGKKALLKIKSLKNGEALLLENVRFLKDEFGPDKKNNNLITTLASLADIFINDAFSVCHRKHTSIVLFPKYLPSGIGRLMQKELDSIKKIKIKNCLYLLGGAKSEDNINLLNGTKTLTYGLFGQLCIISKGKNLGAQNKFLKDKLNLTSKLKKRLKNVQTPVDFAVRFNGKRKELSLNEFPSKYEIFDIGEETIKRYISEIKKAKAVYMKGPAGYCEEDQFCKGTFAVLKAVSQIKGFTLIGGGQLSDAIEKSKINKKKFGYISLSGGALLQHLAGKKLPGVEALKKCQKHL